MRFWRSILCVLFLCGVVLVARGCIRANVFSMMRYNPADDSISAIQVYNNIIATDPKDLDYLQELHELRSKILINPVQLTIFGTEAYLKKGPKEVATISLGEKKPEKLTSSPVDLDSIRVQPGEFFLNANRRLSTYQQINVPGKTIDQLLQLGVSQVREPVIDFANKELSAGPDQPRWTWDSLRQMIVKEIKRGQNDPKPQDPQPELSPLSKETLQLFAKANDTNPITFQRNRDQLIATVKLSDRDANEVLATLDLIRETLPKAPAEKEEIKFFKIFLAHIEAKKSAGGVELNLQAVKLFNALSSAMTDKDPEEDEGYATTIASMKGRGIKVREDLTMDQVLAEYKK